jgi:hypothetical protein
MPEPDDEDDPSWWELFEAHGYQEGYFYYGVEPED